MPITPQPVSISKDLAPSHFARNRFGINNDVSNADLPEDIWSVGGAYPFPAVAATTIIVSDSANDDDGGTGARTVYILGLDTNLAEIEFTIALNGTSNVSIPTNLLRVQRAFVVISGSNLTNVGNISIKHGATTIGHIPAGLGQTESAIFTVPVTLLSGETVVDAELLAWQITSGTITGTNELNCGLRIRPLNESWRRVESGYVNITTTVVEHVYATPRFHLPGTDIVLRVFSGAGNNIPFSGYMDFLVRT